MGSHSAQAPAESIESDPRELEPDFQRLPPAVQELRRAHWVEQEVAWERIRDLERGRRRRAVWDGIGTFAAAELALSFLTGWSGASFVSAVLLGALVGLAWFRLGAGILLAPVLAMPVSLAHQGLLIGSGRGHVVDLLASVFLVGLMSAILGMQRDFGRAS